MSATVDLLDAIRAHLTAFALPELYSVHVITASGEPGVSAQLAAHHSPEIATGLLAWPTPSPAPPPRRGEYPAETRYTSR